MTPSVDSPPATDRRILVYNPAAGDGTHEERIRMLAAERRFEVRETESAEDIVEKAAVAAGEAEVVAAAGGDGTLTRAVRGLDRADAFEETLFGVVPTGTGNNFAGNLGITGIEHGFELIDTGERRRIDVSLINTEPFLNSCVVGLTAEASAETDADSKKRWGPLAYALTTARTVREFDNVHLTIRAAGEQLREYKATIAFIGNTRGFPSAGRTQANVEDGLLEVTVVEDVSTFSLLEESIQAVLGDEAEHVQHRITPSLDVELTGSSSRTSVDGEILTESHLCFAVRERTLLIPVGDAYEPEPYDTAPCDTEHHEAGADE